MDTQRTPEIILKQIACIPTMERGKLSEMRGKGGKLYHNLQFWTEGRNRCEYVPATQMQAIQEALSNYQKYKGLTAEYAAAVERRTRQQRGGAPKTAEKGGSVSRPQARRNRKSPPPSTG